MKKGKIQEQGNHNSLLSEHPNGLYAKLVQQQEQQEEPDTSSDKKAEIGESDMSLKGDENVNIQTPSKYATGKLRNKINASPTTY